MTQPTRGSQRTPVPVWLDELVEETPAPGAEELFPHVYGAVRPAAVVGVTPL